MRRSESLALWWRRAMKCPRLIMASPECILCVYPSAFLRARLLSRGKPRSIGMFRIFNSALLHNHGIYAVLLVYAVDNVTPASTSCACAWRVWVWIEVEWVERQFSNRADVNFILALGAFVALGEQVICWELCCFVGILFRALCASILNATHLYSYWYM